MPNMMQTKKVDLSSFDSLLTNGSAQPKRSMQQMASSSMQQGMMGSTSQGMMGSPVQGMMGSPAQGMMGSPAQGMMGKPMSQQNMGQGFGGQMGIMNTGFGQNMANNGFGQPMGMGGSAGFGGIGAGFGAGGGGFQGTMQQPAQPVGMLQPQSAPSMSANTQHKPNTNSLDDLFG